MTRVIPHDSDLLKHKTHLNPDLVGPGMTDCSIRTGEPYSDPAKCPKDIGWSSMLFHRVVVRII